MATVRYFTHNEVLFQFDDSAGRDPVELVDRTLELANSIDSGLRFKASDNRGDDVIRFRKPDEVSSVRKSYATLKDESGIGAKLTDFLRDLLHQEAEEQQPSPIASVRLHIEAPAVSNEPTQEEIDEQQKKIVAFLANIKALKDSDRISRDLGFQFASPNWLFVGKQGTMPTGGPGGRPSPVLPTAQGVFEQARHFRKDDFDILLSIYDGVFGIFGVATEDPEQINVVVLDTAHPREAVETAYEHFGKNKLLRELSKKLHITNAHELQIEFPHSDPRPDPALTKSTPQTKAQEKAQIEAIDYYKRYGGYPMPDHGLFIAGIIHDIAPTANIHLVEVLNNDGLGTLRSIMRGLSAIESGELRGSNGAHLIFDNHPLIVNMSFCIDFDIGELTQPVKKPAQDNVPNDNTSPVENPLFEYELLMWSLQSLLSPLNRLQGLPHDKKDLFEAIKGAKRRRNVVLIAAAGNEGDPDEQGQGQANPDEPSTPKALYPAAYDGVIGVGALDKAGHRAWYSNVADDPPAVGVSVFGGEAQPPADKTEPARLHSMSKSQDALQGLYISGSYPGEDGKPDPNTKNESGFAWWSGTSFATAIVSGLMANVAKRGFSLGDAWVDAGDFIAFATLLNGKTSEDEPILRITQEG